jgi:hypothetical protein
MATQKPLVIGSGTTAQFPSVSGDSLEIDGAVLAKNTTDSVTAFQVQNAAGTVVLDVDTTNALVGVGTAAPIAALDLASGQLAIPDGSAAAPAIAFRDDLNTGLFSPGNDIVGVGVNGTEIARFQQSGGSPVFLVGTSTVYGQFTFDSTDVTAGAVMLGHGAAGTVLQESYRGGQFAGVRSRGTKAAPTGVGAGDGLVNMLGAGWTSTGGINYGGLVTFKAEEAYTATASGGRIEFHTTLSGTDGFTTLGSATTERMRITNAGRVGIGTSAPGASLEVANSDALVYGLTVGRGGGAVSSNTAVGASALAANAAGGTNNVAVGLNALAVNTIGVSNTALGRQTLAQNLAQSSNTAVGHLSQSKSGGSENTSVGVSSLDTNTGIRCVAVGVNALQANTGNNCIAVGYNALDNNTGDANVAVGFSAMGAAVTGASNVAVGSGALAANTAGSFSVAVGGSALGAATTRDSNVGVGTFAGYNVTTGGVTNPNTALGTSALGGDTVSPGLTGDGNVAVGYSALAVLTGATSNNTAVGTNAGAALTAGSDNAIVGDNALLQSTLALRCSVLGRTAASNITPGPAHADSVAVGYNAEVGTTSLGQNTVVGSSAGGNITSGTNLTLLGYNAEPSAGSTVNQITLGDANVTSLRCAVNTITLISDQRDKAEIQDLTLGLDFLKTVHPVQFKWDRREWYDDGVSDGSKKQDKFEPGFIAQELDAAQTAATAEWLGLALKDNPDRWEATPLRLFPVVVKACQELAAQAAAATARAIEAERRLDALEAALAALQGP